MKLFYVYFRTELCTPKLHLLDRVVEYLPKSGSMEMLDRSLFETFLVHLKFNSHERRHECNQRENNGYW